MEIVISDELHTFLATVLAGLAVGALYDLIRATRKRAPAEGLLLGVQDVVFWAAAAGIVFFTVFDASDGRLRGYELLGAILGAILYFSALSRLFLRVVDWILRVFMKIFLICLKILLTPLLFLYNIINKPILYLSGKLRKIFRKTGGRFRRLMASGRRQIRWKRTKI